MIGTYLIAGVGYGLALLLAYEFIAFGLRTIRTDGLDGTGSGKNAVLAAIGSTLVAVVTRWLTGGAL